MAYKKLVLDQGEYQDGSLNLTLLTGGVKEEAVYAEFHSGDDEPDILELATSVEQMIKMRNYLTNLINKIGKGRVHQEDYYGNVTSVPEVHVEGD